MNNRFNLFLIFFSILLSSCSQEKENSACLEYENTLKKIKEIDPTIEVNKIPQFRLPAAKTYYTIESLNLGDEVHDKVFKDWQLKRKPLGSDKDVENFAKRHNLDVENFMRVYNSFSINIKAKNAIAVPRKLIENGKLTKTLRNPNYRGVTNSFWKNLKNVGDRSTFKIYGTPYCGKGEPNQIIRVGHASPVCHFKNIETFGGN